MYVTYTIAAVDERCYTNKAASSRLVSMKPQCFGSHGTQMQVNLDPQPRTYKRCKLLEHLCVYQSQFQMCVMLRLKISLYKKVPGYLLNL